MKTKKQKTIIYLKRIGLISISLFFVLSIYTTYDFINNHTFRTPILIRFQNPAPYKYHPLISPVGKAKKKVSLIHQAYAAEEPITDQKIADYIRSKDWDYSIAIRIAKSENGWNSRKHFDCTINNAGTNRDGSIDYGIFQINNIHRAKIEAYYLRPFEEVVTNCFDNVDVAYDIYKSSGWYPWSAYNNGSYLNHKEI